MSTATQITDALSAFEERLASVETAVTAASLASMDTPDSFALIEDVKSELAVLKATVSSVSSSIALLKNGLSTAATSAAREAIEGAAHDIAESFGAQLAEVEQSLKDALSRTARVSSDDAASAKSIAAQTAAGLVDYLVNSSYALAFGDEGSVHEAIEVATVNAKSVINTVNAKFAVLPSPVHVPPNGASPGRILEAMQAAKSAPTTPAELLQQYSTVRKELSRRMDNVEDSLTPLVKEAGYFGVAATFIETGVPMTGDTPPLIKLAANQVRTAVLAGLIQDPSPRIRRNSLAALSTLEEGRDTLKRLASTCRVAATNQTASMFEKHLDAFIGREHLRAKSMAKRLRGAAAALHARHAFIHRR